MEQQAKAKEELELKDMEVRRHQEVAQGLGAQLEGLRGRCERLTEKCDAAERAVATKEAEVVAKVEQVASLEEEIEAKQKDAARQMEADAKELATLRGHLDVKAAAICDKDNALLAAATKIASLEKSMRALEQSREAELTALNDSVLSLAHDKETNEAAMREKAEAAAELSSQLAESEGRLRALVEQGETQRDTASKQLAELQRQLDEVVAKNVHVQDELHCIETKLAARVQAEMKGRLKDLLGQIEAGKRDIKKLENERQELSAALDASQARETELSAALEAKHAKDAELKVRLT